MTKRFFLLLIKIYRWTLKPLLGNCCRYSPSCSQYMEQAIKKYGAVKGIKLGMRRILRCSGRHLGGYDPLK